MTPYHHGHLREALVAGAQELIEEVGVESLTIRGLAERVGVSHAAPQYHFVDKASLLVAVATEGFRELSRALEDIETGSDPVEAFVAMGRTYVNFAFASPQRYRLMFASDIPELKAGNPEFCEASGAAFSLLTGAIARYQNEPDASAERVTAAAFFAWSSVHGAVMLQLDGTFPRAFHIEDAEESAVDMAALMQGLLRHVARGLLPGSDHAHQWRVDPSQR